MNYSNIRDKQEKIRRGEISLVENVHAFLERISENFDLNAFNFVNENAVKDAELIEAKIKEGDAGKLAGAVISVKDVLSLKEMPLTCSSNILKNFIPVYTATAVQKLLDEDAIIIGKTNCDEFAMGSSNENSAFGAVKNPYDKERAPGGSSGGSAVSVAANLCDASIGTDTGGSIRQPAAFTGVWGLKPTYGRVSRYGLTAFASSFDTVGPLTKNVSDAALILEVISGKDPKDSTSSDNEKPQYSQLLEEERKFKIGIPKEYFGEGLQKEIKEKIENVIRFLESSGFETVKFSLPHTEYSIATYYILTTAEASANLARYDGVRYGYRSKDSTTLDELYFNSRNEAFGAEVKRRIMLGTYVLSAGYYDKYFDKAQRVRRLIKNDFDKAFEKVDLIIAPTTPTTAFKLGEKNEPLQMYLSDIFTVSANLAGIPAMSLPIGFDAKGLPIGMQVMSPLFNETKILQFAYFLENSLPNFN